jgi:hypothetical protein
MSPLFAQTLMSAVNNRPEALLAMMALAIFLLLIVPVLMLIRNGQRRHEWEHAERMRALEVGLSVPPRDAPWAKASICVAIGFGVPVVAFVCTALAFNSFKAESELWIAPAVVSVLSVISGGVLSGVLFHAKPGSGRQSSADGSRGRIAGPGMKPADDPDAFDVVGRRG